MKQRACSLAYYQSGCGTCMLSLRSNNCMSLIFWGSIQSVFKFICWCDFVIWSLRRSIFSKKLIFAIAFSIDDDLVTLPESAYFCWPKCLMRLTASSSCRFCANSLSRVSKHSYFLLALYVKTSPPSIIGLAFNYSCLSSHSSSSSPFLSLAPILVGTLVPAICSSKLILSQTFF